MFGKARDLPRGRSARLVRHDRVRRLLSLGGRSSGRLSEDLANPPWVCGHRRRTYIRANERVQHHILQSQNGQLVTVWPEEFTTLRAKWILPAFCPRDRVGGPGHLAPGRQGGRVGGRTLTSPAVPASASRKALSTAYPSGRGADGSSQGADAGGHHPRPHRTRRPAQSGAARACWAPQAPLAAAFKHRIHGFCFSLARRGAHFRTPGLIEGGRGSFRTRDGVQ
jgi:hypothetical protein